MVADTFGSSLERRVLPVPTLLRQSSTVGLLTQGGVNRGWSTVIADAVSWVVPPWFAVDTKLKWTRRSQVCGLCIAGRGWATGTADRAMSSGRLIYAGEFPADRCCYKRLPVSGGVTIVVISSGLL